MPQVKYEEALKALKNLLSKVNQMEIALKRRKVPTCVFDSAVELAGDLKKYVTNLQKLLPMLATPSSAKMPIDALLAAMESTSFGKDEELQYPVAMHAAINQCKVFEKVRYCRFSDLKDLMDTGTSPMASVLDRETVLEHNKNMAELILSKAAPRIGRNVRPPLELGETLFQVATVFKSEDCRIADQDCRIADPDCGSGLHSEF